MTRSDVLAKLRGANVGSLSEVEAVILESTGDISVLNGHGSLDSAIMDGVRGASDTEDT